MYTIFAGIILSVILFSLHARRVRGTLKEQRFRLWKYRLLFAYLCVCVGSAILLASLFSGIVPLKTIEEKKEILAMRTADGCSSGFIWESGGDNPALLYRFFTMTDDGRLSIAVFEQSVNFQIIEQEGLGNRGVWIHTRSAPDRSHWTARWTNPGGIREVKNVLIIGSGMSAIQKNTHAGSCGSESHSPNRE